MERHKLWANLYLYVDLFCMVSTYRNDSAIDVSLNRMEGGGHADLHVIKDNPVQIVKGPPAESPTTHNTSNIVLCLEMHHVLYIGYTQHNQYK